MRDGGDAEDGRAKSTVRGKKNNSVGSGRVELGRATWEEEHRAPSFLLSVLSIVITDM